MFQQYAARVKQLHARALELNDEAEKEGNPKLRARMLLFQSGTLMFLALVPPLARLFERYCWR